MLDIFWIRSLKGTFIALQMKSFGPKNSNFMQGFFKECYLGKSNHSIGKITFVLCADEYLERLEGKVRKCFFYFKIYYSKITVWILCIFKRKPTICDKSTANNPWQPCGLLDTVSKRPRLAWTTSGLEQDFKLWWQWLHMAIKMDFWWSMLYQSSTLVSLWK